MISIPANFDKANWRHWLAFGFGSGFSSRAPGTVGTMLGLLLYLPLSQFSPFLYAVTVIACFALGVWVCETTSMETWSRPARSRMPCRTLGKVAMPTLLEGMPMSTPMLIGLEERRRRMARALYGARPFRPDVFVSFPVREPRFLLPEGFRA